MLLSTEKQHAEVMLEHASASAMHDMVLSMNIELWYLCAVDLVVWEVRRVLKLAIWTTYQELPAFLASLVQQRT